MNPKDIMSQLQNLMNEIPDERVEKIVEFAKNSSIVQKELEKAKKAGDRDQVFALTMALLIEGTSLPKYLASDGMLEDHFNGFITTNCPTCVERSAPGKEDSPMEKAIELVREDKRNLALYLSTPDDNPPQ